MNVSVDLKSFKKELEAAKKKFFEATLIEYTRIALDCVTEARKKKPSDEYKAALNSLANSRGQARAIIGSETPGFNDQTAILRASMGYVIFYNGKQVDANFEGVSSGKSVGGSFAKKIAAEYQKGWAIVIVAGADYASHVEALGYDVITGSTLGMAAKFNAAHKRIDAAFK